MATLRNVMLWVMMVIGVAGCREMMWPVEPGSGGIVIRTITTDVQHGGTFSIEGQNLDRLAGQGRVVFYEGQNIRLPMQLVIGTTLFGCILPDSVRSGRVRVEDGDGSILMDTLLNVYGDPTELYPPILQPVCWNQWQWIAERIEPIFIDQRSKRHPWIKHPYEKNVWLVPHCQGRCRLVQYDSRSRLYHELSPSVRLDYPVLTQAQYGDDHAAVITKYVRTDGERIRLRSQDHVYEREVQWFADRLIIPLAGMQPGRYTAEIVKDARADAIDGELVIPMSVSEGRGLASSWIMIRGSIAMSLNVVTDYIGRNGERDRDSVTRDTIIDIYCDIRSCRLERISGDTFRFDGVDEESDKWNVEGVLVKRGQTMTVNLMLKSAPREGLAIQVHTLRLRQWPSTQDQEGRVGVRMPDRVVDESEYGCSYSDERTIQYSSHMEVRSFRTAKGSTARIRGLEIGIQF